VSALLSTTEELQQRLQTLNPTALQIDDESAQHAGHAGTRDGKGHYRVAICAPCFAGFTRLERHRLVLAAVGDLMQSAIHALAIEAKTPEERET
jgi:BolA family transcriptional regulator, general stress-responsive regulator